MDTCEERSTNSQPSGIANMGAESGRHVDIARLSVDVVAYFKDKYPDEILEAFTFVAKYMTIAALSRDERRDIGAVVNPDYCPLCKLHFSKTECKDCTLVGESGVYCGGRYTSMRKAVEEGSYTEAAFHVGAIAREILKKGGKVCL